MKNLIFSSLCLSCLLLCFSQCLTQTQKPLSLNEEGMPILHNPMSTNYLKKNLTKQNPRLVLNSSIEKNLKEKLDSDLVVQNLFEALKLNASKILNEPLLERKKTGRRLLSVSREFLYRMNTLGMVYRIEKETALLERINKEILAVCGFSDWNPSHYLDVAEMALGLALAIDWASEDLPASTLTIAKKALIDKGIIPSYNPEGNVGWINGTNNWNQVCHAGMIAASIVIAEEDPELAAKTIHRALEGIPHAMVEYGPDGVYPEGSTYWGYGTAFTVMTIAMLESAFDTDFGLGDYPAFKESAIFRVLCNAPSGQYYNFADCGDRRKDNGDLILAWFAAKTGNSAYFEKERFLVNPLDMGKLNRNAGSSIVWVSQINQTKVARIPTAWKGEGSNPVAFFTNSAGDLKQFYFGAKGGRGMVNHGNMDGGSFIFELNGVRWVIDPGNQNYHDLEKTGFQLWGRCQDCERWTLLTKNNYGHSTITVDGKLHITEGLTSIIGFRDGDQPEVNFDLTPSLDGQIKKATRKFIKDSNSSILIEDNIEILDKTKMITWQLITTADVEFSNNGVTLHQDGQQLKVQNLSHPEIAISVISLDPPPLKLDRQIKGLKRLELNIPTYLMDQNKTKIRVRLTE